MRGSLTLVWGIVPAVLLVLLAGCPQVSNVPPVDPNAPAPIDAVVDPISVFLSANRPRLIRNDAVQGSAVITARTSREAQVRWSYAIVNAGRVELEGRPASDLIQIGGPNFEDGVDESRNTIESIIRDPGLAGSVVRVTVDAFDPETPVGPNDVPLDTAEVLVVLARPQSALRVNAVSVSGVSLEPLPRNRSGGQLDAPTEFQFTLRADIDGGTQFNRDEIVDLCDESVAQDACCRQADAGAGAVDRYHVKWRMVASPDGDSACLLGPIAGAQNLLFDDPITGLVRSTVNFTAPGVSGNVAFEVVVTDASGNRGSTTVDVTVAPNMALTVADAAPQSPLIEPGRCVTVQATGQGGVGSYVADFTLSATQVAGRLIPGPCAAVLDVSRLRTSVRGVARPDGVFEAAFWAVEGSGMPGRGSVLVTSTISDDVTAAASTSFPIEMRATRQLSLAAFFDVPALDLNRSTLLSATVAGGTSHPRFDVPNNRTNEGYMVCFKIEAGTGTLTCENVAGFTCFLPNAAAAKEACVTGKAESDYKIRYNASNIPGSDTIRVTLRDFFDELTTTTGINITPVGSQGGGGVPNVPQCPGGFASLQATPADPLVCVARTDNNVVPAARLPGSETLINASTSGGTAPYTYTFTLVGVQQADLAPGEGLGAIGEVTTQVVVSSCANGAMNPSSTAQATYFAPDTRMGNRTIFVTVKDQASPTATTFVLVEAYSPTSSAGPDRVVTSADPLPTSLGGAPSGAGGDVDPLAFLWTDGPNAGGVAFLVDPDANDGLQAAESPNPLFDNTAAVGIYDLCLTVSDATGCASAPDCMRITVNVPGNCDDGNPCTQDAFVNNQCQNAPFTGTALDPTNDCRFVICNFGFPSAPANLPFNTMCNSPMTASDPNCDAVDTCDGFGNCIPNFATPGTMCGSQTDTSCDNPNTCNAAGDCLDNFEPVGTLCGSPPNPPNNQCANQDSCDGTGMCVPNNINNGSPCNDGIFCNGADVCQGGMCQASNINPCSGGMPVCDPVSDMCVQCTNNGQCPSDGMACNGPETCNLVTNMCQSGPPVVCGGGTPLCLDPAGTCVQCLVTADCAGTPAAPLCDTATNQCVGCLLNSDCAGDPINTICDATEATPKCVQCLSDLDCGGNTPICNEVVDLCVECNTGADCDDANDCTIDTCIANACSNASVTDGTGCDDGVFCNGADSCVGGACSMHDNVNPCPGNNPVCDSVLDMCRGCMSNPECDDGNSCTADTCNIQSGNCSNQNVADDTPCNDGLFCTANDLCLVGVCMGSGSPCIQPSPTCDESTDSCGP